MISCETVWDRYEGGTLDFQFGSLFACTWMALAAGSSRYLLPICKQRGAPELPMEGLWFRREARVGLVSCSLWWAFAFLKEDLLNYIFPGPGTGEMPRKKKIHGSTLGIAFD